ncbi:MAG: site-specific integrase [Rhodospirillales bacterium]|nr:site-specific integrase [Rhodospirillales bacterium]
MRTLKEIAGSFRLRLLNEIGEQEWVDYADRRQRGNQSATRERYLNDIVAFLAWCRKKPRQWLAELPTFDRDNTARNPNTRQRRRVQELSPALIRLMIECAAPHFAPQLAVEWSTGARVSSVLHGCRLCDLILAEGREQITFHDTKNGKPVYAALHPWAAGVVADYLKWRGNLQDREAPLFLTQRHKPYKPNGGAWGGQNKTAFNGMKRRAIQRIRKQAAAEARRLRLVGQRDTAIELVQAAKAEAALVAQVTQHWFRHLLATTIMGDSGDIRSAMEQGGWQDPRSVIGYTHDVPERRRALIRSWSIDTSSTRAPEGEKKSG